jgi:catechol 2,3-dioxygenase-like lactoylglutathione lyase family enzyme
LTHYRIFLAAQAALLQSGYGQRHSAPPAVPDMKAAGLRHLAIAVTDFDAVYEALKGKGVSFLTQPEKKGGNAVVFFTDCDGNILHLLQREKPLA